MIYAGLGGGKAAGRFLHFLVCHMWAGDRTPAWEGRELGYSPTVEVCVLTTHCGADACPWVGHPGVGAAAQGTAHAEEAWEGDQSPALAQVRAVTLQPLVPCCIPTLGLVWSPSTLLKSRCRYTRDSPWILAGMQVGCPLRVQSTAFKTPIISIVPTKFRPEVFKWAWEGFQGSTYTGPTVVKILSGSGQARVHRLKHFIQQNKPAQGSKGEKDHRSLVFFILMATSIIRVRITPVTAV